MNDSSDKRSVIAFIKRIPPLWWVEWKFKAVGTPAGERLTSVLFDPETDSLRDLRSEDVRDRVIECVLEHENLLELVLKDVAEFVEKAGDEKEEAEETARTLPDDFSYKCGLRPGDRVRLVRDLPIENHEGELTHVHPAGEVWTVLGPSSDPTVLWLRQADGEPHTWDDADNVFDQFRRV